MGNVRILTWFAPDTGQTYCAISPKKGEDRAIPDRPDSPAGALAFNPETGAWEPAYEVPADPDAEVSIGEAEALWQEAQQGSVTASVLLKLLEL